MDNFIFEQKKNQKDVIDVKFYTILGQEDFLDADGLPRASAEDNINIVAKHIVKQNNQSRYSIKIGLNNKLSNPTSIYGSEKESSFLDSVCRANNKFIDVNLKTFQLYLNFLKTKNTSWLHNAERELT